MSVLLSLTLVSKLTNLEEEHSEFKEINAIRLWLWDCLSILWCSYNALIVWISIVLARVGSLINWPNHPLLPCSTTSPGKNSSQEVGLRKANISRTMMISFLSGPSGINFPWNFHWELPTNHPLDSHLCLFKPCHHWSSLHCWWPDLLYLEHFPQWDIFPVLTITFSPPLIVKSRVDSAWTGSVETISEISSSDLGVLFTDKFLSQYLLSQL